MEKTIKYLENGEYHYATVKDVGDLAKLKTDSKDDLVTAINDLFENGGKNAGKPEGYDKLVDQMADTIKKQQDISGKLNSAENDLKQKIADSNSSNRTITDELNAQIEVERQKVEALRLAAEQARKELNEQVAKLNADSQELSKKTTDLANDVENKFGSIQNDYKTVSENLTNEAAALHKQLGDVKNEAETTKSRIQDQAEDIGNIHKTVDNVSNQVTQKIWMTDLDPVKQQVTQNSTEVQETQNQLKTKAEQSSLDLVANSVEKLDTEVKKNSEGLEVTVKKEEFAEDVAKLLKDKTNLLLGTRNFAGDKWSNLDHWHEEPGYWNGLKFYSSTSDWYGIQYQYEVKKGNQYTFSFYARQQSENNSAYIVLSEGSTGAHLACTEPYQKSDIHIGTEWKRYSLTFQAIADGTIYPRVEQSVTNNTIYVAGYKLELGKVATPWEPNEADAAENIEHNESKLNVFSDKVESVVKKQEQLGSTQNELETKVTQNAEGLKQASHQLEDANGKINKFQGDLESTAKGLKASYEEYTNKAIGQISDSSLNLIRNGSFSNKDSDFDQWQNVSAKVNIREDENGLRWAEITQSGMTTDNPQGITSNYFVIKQGKVTVAVDIKLGDKATLDNQNILLLELYNDNKQRVDFTDVSVSQLGLSTAILNDHNVHRGLYRLGIDREDVKYMTVKAILHRNGDLWLTNFSARLSSIDDGGYTPNPDDVNQQILKMNTKIEEDAEHIALKANSVDVTRDIKDAVQNSNGGGVNLLKNSEGPFRPTGIYTTTIADNYGIYDSSTVNMIQGQTYTVSGQTNGVWSGTHDPNTISNKCVLWLVNDQISIVISADTMPHTFTWNYPTGTRKLRVNAYHKGADNTIYAEKIKIERGTVATPWSPAPEDTSAEIKSAKDAAIQVASDQINIKTNELTTKYNESLNQRINESKSASEKFTSDQIVQTVKKITDVQGNVDKLDQLVKSNNGGGINLLKGTANFRPDDIWFPLGAWIRTSEKYNGLTVFKVHVDENWNGLTQYYPVKAGETYTFSLNARYESGNGKSIFYIELNDPQQEAGHNRAHVNPSSQSVLLTEDWNRYSITFTVNSDGYIKPRIERGSDNKNVLEICGFKLERGSVATPWSSAPEDVEATYSTLREEIKSSKEAAIKVASDNVQIKVDELSTTLNDSINQKVNEAKTASEKFTSDGIEQTVRKITDVQNNVNNLKEKVDSNNGGGINLQKGTKDCSFQIGTNGNPSSIETYNSDTKMIHTQNGGFYTSYSDSSFVPTPGEFYTISADVKGDGAINGSGFRYEGGNNGTMGNVTLNDTWQRIINTVHVDRVQGQWVIYPSSSKNLYVKHIKIERGTIATPWTPAPEDVEATHTLEIANIDDMKSQGHYFVHNLTGTPIPGWVYVDVTGNGLDRIRQDVYADQTTKHMYRRLFGSSWSDWEQGAYISDVNNLKNETTAKITNLGDRVTTEVNSVTTKINDSHTNDVELIRNNNFPDGNKGSWNGNLTTVIDGNNIPAELGQNGMKVLRVIQRDTYEDDIWYSVKPGEIFDVDYWIWPTGSYDSQLGLCFVDKDKGNSTWRGVVAKKGTGWTHYTGTIEAPSNAAFAKPWIQVDKDASETGSAAWIGKPSIRRHDSFAEQKISEINTKLDVANGKIEGKVTETQVNDILNGKGYATQSWAESNFRMKSDSIELEVRKITDPISGQVNNVSNKLDNLQVGGRNLLHGTSDQWKTLNVNNGNGWLQATTASTCVTSTADYHTGSTFTYAAKITNNSHQQAELEIWLLNQNNGWNGQSFHALIPKGANAYDASVTFPITADTRYIRSWVIFTGGNAPSGDSVQVKDERLVEGNLAMDWSPNPEDIAQKIKSNNGGGINLLTNSAGVFKPTTERIDNYVEYNESTVDLVQGQEYTISGETNGQWSDNHQPGIESDRCVLWLVGGSPRFSQIVSDTKTGTGTTFTWNYPSGNYCLRINVYHPSSKNNIYAKNIKLEKGTVATPWSPSPEDIAKKIDTQTLDSANIDNMRTQGHYFVHNLDGNPIGGWVYVDVSGNGLDRIRQDVYQDSNSIVHFHRKLFGNSWTPWEKEATQTDINNLRTETTASIKNLGDRVTTEVSSVTTKINDLQIGGRNYLRDSDKSTTGWMQDLGMMPNETLNQLAGKTITVSCDVEWSGYAHDNSKQNRLGFEASVKGSDGHDYWIGAWKSPNTSSGKERISTQYTLPAGVTFTVNNNGQNGYVSINGSGKVSHVKIEIGNRMTDWTPAPEDETEKIDALNTKLDVANGKINASVSETRVNDILNSKGYATQSWTQGQINLTKDQFNVKVQEVKNASSGGGVNLINDTNGDFIIDGTSTHTQGWTFWVFHINSELKVGDQLTISAEEATLTGKGDTSKFYAVLYNEQTTNPRSTGVNIPVGKNVSGTIKVTNFDGVGPNVLLIYSGTPGDTHDRKLVIKHLKLEKGPIATPWSPSSSDTPLKSNLISEINATPETIKLSSNKIEIDGNTYIHGTLNVPEVKLQGKKGLVNLAGDSGLELLSNDGNKVEVGSSGIKLSSGMTKGLNSYIKESGFSLNVDSRGMRLTNTLTIQGRMNGTSDYNFLKLEPGVLSVSNNQIPSGTIAYVPNNYSRELGPESPGGFFALGREDVDTNGDLIQRRSEVAYVTKSTDGWDQGFTIKAPFFIQPPDANHGIRATWVSWSQWDWGERYPALVNNTTNWGGICFPSSGRVTLFDSKGKYYTPDKDTGIGPYDNYG